MKFNSILVTVGFVLTSLSSWSQDDGYNDAYQVIAAAQKTVAADVTRLAQPGVTKEQQTALRAEIKANDARTDELAKKFPLSDKVQTAATQEALQGRDWTRARTYGDRAVELAQAKQDGPSLLAALNARGTAAWFAGDFPQAAQDAQRALKIDPKDKAAMALWQFSKGRLRANAPGLTVPADAERDRRLDELLAAQSPLDDPAVKAAGRRATNRLEALKRLGEARRLYAVGDLPAALKESQAALEADPELPDAYMERALVLTALKEIARALEDVSKAISLWAQRGDARALPAAHVLRSQLKGRSGDRAGAFADADKAASLDPRFAPAYRARGEAREALGQKGEQILADYKKAAELDPQLAGYYDDAVARLSGRAPAASKPSAASRSFDLFLLAAAGLLAALIGFVLRLARGAGGRAAPAVENGRRALDAQYDLVEQVGEGGMGMVYRGWDKTLKRPVAVKRLRAELQRNPRERDRFIREAEMVASLRHPHIVEIYNIVRNAEDTYLVFEYIVGMTVHQLLNASPGRHLPPSRALELLSQVAEAVDHAHSRRVIHRDLKPANIMVADGGWAKVMDFGIARQVQDSLLTTTNTIVGTPTYMAPEQAMGAVVKESDVYALGCTLYEMLTGALPFKGADETRDKLEGRFVAPSLLVPDLPPAVDAVMKRALAPRAEERYHTCAELYRAASHALGGRVTPMRS